MLPQSPRSQALAGRAHGAGPTDHRRAALRATQAPWLPPEPLRAAAPAPLGVPASATPSAAFAPASLRHRVAS
eukprot:6198147-Pleurochrysis_carterae.AAC.3